jgi:HAD superfamily hydrolase (TIGR01509 family)
MVERYRSERPPVIAAGLRAAHRLAERWPLAVASSAHPAVIDAALASLGLAKGFAVVLSADDVGIGKPAPDVYLAAAARLAVAPASCLVIEDSPAGVQAARTAGMRVVLVPPPGHPPLAATDELATLVLASLDELDEACLAALEAG